MRNSAAQRPREVPSLLTSDRAKIRGSGALVCVSTLEHLVALPPPIAAAASAQTARTVQLAARSVPFPVAFRSVPRAPRCEKQRLLPSAAR